MKAKSNLSQVRKEPRNYWRNIRNMAKAAGGRWNPEKQLWFVSYGNVVGTALEKYIDVDGFDK